MSQVIMYHYIRNFDDEFPYFNFLSLEDFKKQNDFFSKRKEFISLKEDLSENYNRDKFLLTFDDGLKEHLNIAKFLKKKNILGLFFIPTMQLENKDFLPIHKMHLIFGKYNSFELVDIFKKFEIKTDLKNKTFDLFQGQKKFFTKSNKEMKKKIFLKTILNNIEQKDPKLTKNIFNFCFNKTIQKKIFKNFYLNFRDIRELDNMGMQIGCHSYGHKVFSKMSYKQQYKDISKSLNFLSRILKKKINYFCYPYGGFKVLNKNTIQILKKKKILYSFNVDSKNWSSKSNKLLIPRFDCNEFKFGKIYKYN
jgi:peptidoglycan/xylan/chitin deacetylase (PgdA/CDA1 family)